MRELALHPPRSPRASSPTSVLLRRNRVTELRRSETLVDISQAFAAAEELSRSLFRVLEMLERHHDVVKAAFVFRDPDTDELVIEAGIGITADGMRARYKLGEGIIGRVVQSAKPIVVPDVSREPLFLNRASRRRSLQGHGAELRLRADPLRPHRHRRARRRARAAAAIASTRSSCASSRSSRR